MGAVSSLLSNLMWGELGWYPPSPGKIVNPPKDLKKPHGDGHGDHAWIKVKQLKPYHAHKEGMIKINKGEPKGKDQTSSHNSADDKNRLNSSEERSRPNSACLKGKGCLRALQRESSPQKWGQPPKDEKNVTIPESSTLKWMMAGPVATFKWQPTRSEPVKDADPHFHHFLLSQTEQAITKKLKICEEETGSTSIRSADSMAVNGSITDKKIGFGGLGLMRSGIVSNLLKMGHTVTVWSRTEGACLGRTPAEVLSTCDITFAHVLDPKVAKDLVLVPIGMLQGIRPGKCYVDLSTVDADIVTELARVIASRSGDRFPEAPLSGNQQLSNHGMLVILAAGDRGLYEDCSSCFQAMGKTSFLGEVGNAAKMMLIVNIVQGSFMATITEVLTLSQQTLLDILNQGQLASIFLDQKRQNTLQGNFKPDFYLKYMQQDLCLAIALGNVVNHLTPMAAAANEVYKRAKALDQTDNMSTASRAYIH
uniref:Cytokine-like nuclear factor N-PAC n=1 Tax=Nomascus leucogenys TaxID=61853 RepID=A0A2I3GSH1_NOMLE